MIPLIIAHRGGKFWESDDFSYISESIRDGADIIELDVRLRGGKYIIQHMPWDKVQGTLENALKRIENATVYLDIKCKIDINEFISYIQSLCSNKIIIGSFDVKMLSGIQDKTVMRNCHCLFPWNEISRAKSCDADWINLISYFISKSFASEIENAGFKFVPSGSEIFKKSEMMSRQVQFARWGAYAISTYHVKEMRQALLRGL